MLCGRPSGPGGFPQNVKYVVRFRELGFALELSGKAGLWQVGQGSRLEDKAG